MQRAVILGAGSQIAPFLSARLVAAGYEGVALSREAPPTAPPALHPAFAWQPFDLEGVAAWPRAWTLDARLFSSVPLWLLPPHIPDLARQGLRHVVAFSSTSVVTKQGSMALADRALAERLGAAESAVQAACATASIPCTILRPTLVYGSGRDQNISAILRFIRRFGFVPIARPGAGLRQPVHAEDLAIAAVRAAERPAAQNRVFALPGGECLTYAALVGRLFGTLQRKPRLVAIPPGWLRLAARLLGSESPGTKACAVLLRMNEDLAFDYGAAEEVLEYRPRAFLQAECLMDQAESSAVTCL